MPHKFITSGVVLAAFLELKLNTVADVAFDPETGRRPVIMLEDSETLQRLVKQYFAGAEVSAKRLADQTSMLRSRINELYEKRKALRLSMISPSSETKQSHT